VGEGDKEETRKSQLSYPESEIWDSSQALDLKVEY